MRANDVGRGRTNYRGNGGNGHRLDSIGFGNQYRRQS